MKTGRYVDPDGNWFDVSAVAEFGRKKLVVYNACHRFEPGKWSVVATAEPPSEIKKKKWRPIEDKDYPGGSAAAYYRGC